MDFLIDIRAILTFLYFLVCFALAGFALMLIFWMVAIFTYWQEWLESRTKKSEKITQDDYIDLIDGDS